MLFLNFYRTKMKSKVILLLLFIRSRQSTPLQHAPKRRLDYDTSQPIYQQRTEPKPLSRSENDGRRPFEMTGNVMRADTQVPFHLIVFAQAF